MSLDYYILKPAVDTPETGNAYPAAESYDHYDFDMPNSVHKLNFREFPDFEPDIRFKLAKGAKLTDMLSQAAISVHGFLINGKLRTAFEQFSIVPHRYYPATVEDRQGNLHQYFWMHLVWEERFELLNFQKTKFFAVKKGNKEYFEIKTPEEFQEKKKELGFFSPLKIENGVLNQTDYDLMLHPLKANELASLTIKDYFSNNNSFAGLGFELWEL